MNTQRSLIFTTALPPVNVAWTRFILNRMPDFYSYRMKLSGIAEQLRTTLANRGFETRGDSHIVPFLLCGVTRIARLYVRVVPRQWFFRVASEIPDRTEERGAHPFLAECGYTGEDYDCLMEFIEISL